MRESERSQTVIETMNSQDRCHEPGVILDTGEPGEIGGVYFIHVEARVSRSGAPSLIAWVNWTTSEKFIKKIPNMGYEDALGRAIESAVLNAPLRSYLHVYITSRRVRWKSDVHLWLQPTVAARQLELRWCLTLRNHNLAWRLLHRKSISRRRKKQGKS
jgi:hypothetical protein